jgi:hypothetical protein
MDKRDELFWSFVKGWLVYREWNRWEDGYKIRDI